MEKEIKDMNAAEYAAFIERMKIAAKAEDDEEAARFARYDKMEADDPLDEDDAEDR
jgi:hypothetical protein